MKYTPRLPGHNPNFSERSVLKEFMLLAGSIGAVVVFVYFALGVAIDQIVKLAPDRFEMAIGQVLAAKFESDPKYETERARLQEIVSKLQAHLEGRSSMHFEVHIVDDETVNALAYPGGHIIIFSGLLKDIETENEMAMILGHELGHYENRDQLQGLGRAFALSFLCSFFFDEDSFVQNLLRSGLNLAELRHSRKQEEKADATGLKLLNETYGHVGGATRFFERLSEKGEESSALAFLATHPLSANRVSTLRALIKKRGYLARPPKKF